MRGLLSRHGLFGDAGYFLRRVHLQIERWRDSPPGAAALFRCWLSVRLARANGPLSVRLGPFRVHAQDRDELNFLLHEVFLRQDYLAPIARPDPFIVDCGANVGFSSLYFKLRWPRARIICFEPNPSCFPYLERNVRENGLQEVLLVEAACGKQEGEISFFVRPGFSPVGSIYRERAANTREIKVKSVKVSDHITEDVDLLKVDVEGAEWDILDDLIESEKISRIRYMAIEYHHHLGGKKARLSRFLRMIEQAGFTYDIEASANQKFTGAFQDVMILASRIERL